MKKERREFIAQLGTMAATTILAISTEAFAEATEFKVFSSPAMRGILGEFARH